MIRTYTFFDLRTYCFYVCQWIELIVVFKMWLWVKFSQYYIFILTFSSAKKFKSASSEVVWTFSKKFDRAYNSNSSLLPPFLLRTTNQGPWTNQQLHLNPSRHQRTRGKIRFWTLLKPIDTFLPSTHFRSCAYFIILVSPRSNMLISDTTYPKYVDMPTFCLPCKQKFSPGLICSPTSPQSIVMGFNFLKITQQRTPH